MYDLKGFQRDIFNLVRLIPFESKWFFEMTEDGQFMIERLLKFRCFPLAKHYEKEFISYFKFVNMLMKLNSNMTFLGELPSFTEVISEIYISRDDIQKQIDMVNNSSDMINQHQRILERHIFLIKQFCSRNDIIC